MNERINDKVEEIEKYLAELDEIRPKTLNEYLADLKTKAACERYVEKVMEAVTDLAFLLIKDKSLQIPEEDAKAFEILVQSRLIDKKLGENLQLAKGMRNVLAHQYGEIDDEIVFNAISDQLETDVKRFIHLVKKLNKLRK